MVDRHKTHANADSTSRFVQALCGNRTAKKISTKRELVDCKRCKSKLKGI